MLVLLAGCAAPDAPLTASATVDPSIATVIHVAWSPAELATVEYERSDGTLRAVTGEGGATLLGLRADTDVRWRFEGGEWRTARTGPLPTDLPAVTVTGDNGGAYVLLSWQEFPAESTGVYIIDGAGEIVWYHLPEAGIVPAAHDVGGALLLMRSYHDVIEEAEVELVPLDGAAPTVDPLPYAHHDAIAIPDARYAAIVGEVREVDGEPVVGDRIVERLADGTDRVVWNAFDTFPVEPHDAWGAGTYAAGRDWTHANGLFYDPVEDAYYLSLFYLRAVVKIDRATGATRWVLGGPYGTLTLPNDDGPGRQHAPEWRDGALGLFDNGYGDPAGSRLVRYTVDEAAGTATRDWEWRHPDALFSIVLGDIDALADGGHLSSWGSYAQVVRTDDTGAVVWTAQLEPGFMVAQVELFDGF